MPYYRNYAKPSAFEKLTAVLSYIFPLIGFVFIIIAALMKKDLKPFLKYHIFQSIFIAFALWLILTGLTYLFNLLSYIPVLKNIIGMITFFLNTPIIFGFSIITFVYCMFIFYLIFGVIRGSDSYVPWVSDIIKTNLKGQI